MASRKKQRPASAGSRKRKGDPMGTGFADSSFRPHPSSPQAFTYDGLKQLAADLDRPAATLVVLSPANDPFYIGMARREDAGWFADLWSTSDIGGGIHLRRLHYVFVSREVPTPNA